MPFMGLNFTFFYRILSITVITSIIYFMRTTLPTNTAWKRTNQNRKFVLVTGAAGFIGHHVVIRLKKDNVDVIGIDNFNEYYDVSLKHLRANLSNAVLNMDVCDADRISDLFGRYNFTHVIHLAAQAGVRYSIKNPLAYVKSNIECFTSLLETMKSQNIPLIYASSSSIYGKNDKYPYSETDEVNSPVSMYAASKRGNELIAHVYWNLYKQKSVGLRFFTVYGPLGRPDMAYFSFTKNILDGEPIKVYQNGDLFRDFTYIDDIVDGIVKCIDVEYEYEILNLGRGEPQSVGALVTEIENAVGKAANILYTPIAPGEVRKTFADISKARTKIGFNPQVSLNDGLQQFVSWFKIWYPEQSTKVN